MYYHIIRIINNYKFETELEVYHPFAVNHNAHIWLGTSIGYLISM